MVKYVLQFFILENRKLSIFLLLKLKYVLLYFILKDKKLFQKRIIK